MLVSSNDNLYDNNDINNNNSTSSFHTKASAVSCSWEFLHDRNTATPRRCQNEQLRQNFARHQPVSK